MPKTEEDVKKDFVEAFCKEMRGYPSYVTHTPDAEFPIAVLHDGDGVYELRQLTGSQHMAVESIFVKAETLAKILTVMFKHKRGQL